MEETKRLTPPSWWQLSPFLIFIVLFAVLHLLFYQAPAESKTGVALFSCLSAIIFSFTTFPPKTPLNRKVMVFVQGAAQPTIIYMSYIFILSSVFTHFVSKNNGVESAVAIGLQCIPSWAVLPGLFTAASLFSLTIGTSMGTIAAFMPIALGFGKTLQINSSFIAAVIVSGAMLGDNLSLISDTTIAAVQVIGCKMSDKFKHNGLLVACAFSTTLLVLVFVNCLYVSQLVTSCHLLTIKDAVNIIPYVAIFFLALGGLDVLAVLTLGIVLAAVIGLWYGNFTFLQATAYLFQGFYTQPDMVNVLMLVMFIAGLAHIIDHNGGIQYLLSQWQDKVTSAKRAELSIAFFAFLINAAIVINTITILILGPIAKKLGERFGITPARTASLLDIFACICQGLMPYSPQLLLASAMARTSSVSLLPYMYYQYFIALITLLFICVRPKQSEVE